TTQVMTNRFHPRLARIVLSVRASMLGLVRSAHHPVRSYRAFATSCAAASKPIIVARHPESDIPMQINAIRVHEQGDIDRMKFERVELSPPKPAEARVRHEAIGVNYIDTYHRSGLYKLPTPTGIGVEAAGVVDAIGSAVTHLKIGDRVAYCGGPIGAYAQA